MSPCKFFPLSFRACIFHHHSLLNNILSSWLINYFNFVFQTLRSFSILESSLAKELPIFLSLQSSPKALFELFQVFLLLHLTVFAISREIAFDFFCEIVVVDVEDVAAVAFVIFGQFFGSMTWPYLCYIHKDLTFQGQKLIRH